MRGRAFAAIFFAFLAALTLPTVAGTAAEAQSRIDVLDLHHLPLGDGRISDGPRRGYVFSCQQHFDRNGPGAFRAGIWIHGATWDLTEKLSVQGDVAWPAARFKEATPTPDRPALRLMEGNGLPLATPTGEFPVASGDPAFQYDRNPNSIRGRDILLALPREPALAAAPSCLPLDIIGIALNGVPIFDALDATGRDAMAHEVLDRCGGHPQDRGSYHYHGPSPCLPNQNARDTLIGYALDGFGIASLYDENGREITNADLDECHGRVGPIRLNGETVTVYHYALTREYPYTLGCFRGTPIHIPHDRGPPG